MADTGVKLTVGEIVIVAAGAADLVFSFLPWYTFGDNHVGAWGTTLFPLATLVPILGALMMVQVVVHKLTSVSLPPLVGDFTWEQLHLVAAVSAAVIAFCYLFVSRGSLSLGFGYYLDLLAAVALVVGAVMIRSERNRRGPSPLM